MHILWLDMTIRQNYTHPSNSFGDIWQKSAKFVKKSAKKLIFLGKRTKISIFHQSFRVKNGIYDDETCLSDKWIPTRTIFWATFDKHPPNLLKKTAINLFIEEKIQKIPFLHRITSKISVVYVETCHFYNKNNY